MSQDGANSGVPSNQVSKSAYFFFLNVIYFFFFTFKLLEVIIEQAEMLKQEVLQAVSNFGAVKIWIQLNIPRIEDGNNFGVGIQVWIQLGKTQLMNKIEGRTFFFEVHWFVVQNNGASIQFLFLFKKNKK